GSELVAVMRRDGALAEDYARRHGVPRWYDNADALIHDSEVDAVYIAAPPGAHEELALKVCAAGKPAYIEKPMARSHAECARINAAFVDAGVPLFVAFYRRGLPRFVKAKELIESGAIGQISAVVVRYSSPAHRHDYSGGLPWRLQAEHAGAGLFLDLGSHTLDALDFMLGPLDNVSGVAANIASAYDVEDCVAASFRIAGAPGSALWNFAAPGSEDLIEITGTQGRITFPTFGNDPVRLESEVGVQEFDLPNPPHVQQPLIQRMVNELRGVGTCPSTGETAARTSLVMDTMLDSYYSGRADEFWLRPGSWPGRRESNAPSR
ncbi:MAG TPA: Gfo/Idh/MocA family oxidoreductase, partial [Abditibacteriaceae bacterium]